MLPLALPRSSRAEPLTSPTSSRRIVPFVDRLRYRNRSVVSLVTKMSGLPSPLRSARSTPRPLLESGPAGTSPAAALTSTNFPVPVLRYTLCGRPSQFLGGQTSKSLPSELHRARLL